jgi:hypothetical protein
MGFFHSPTHADVVLVQFSSRVTHVQNAPVFGISATVGNVVTGQFTYDTDALDTDPTNPNRGIYSGGSFSFTLNGHTVTGVGPSQYVVHNLGPPGNDIFGHTHGSPQGTGPLLINGIAQTGGWSSRSFSQPAGGLPNDRPPSAALFATLQLSQFNLVETVDNGVILFDNVISMVVSVVPEYSSFALVGSSGGALLIATAFRASRARRKDIAGP